MEELLKLYADRKDEIQNARFSNTRWTWQEFVPEELRAIWVVLPFETQLAVYLTAHEAFVKLSD